MEPEKDVVDIRDFLGLALDADPHDRSPGVATDQVNCTSVDRGELQSRNGYRFVTFEA